MYDRVYMDRYVLCGCVSVSVSLCVYLCMCMCMWSANLSCPGPVCWCQGVGVRMPSMKDPCPVSVCIMT